MLIKDILNKYVDNNYKLFQEKIVSSNYPILGIKIPLLRKIVKDLLKNYDYQDILNNLSNNSFEEIIMEGLVIASIKIDYNERINLINNYLPKIDNWATCDVFCGSLKFVKENKKEFYEYLNEIINNYTQEYYLRFAIVMFLNYYLDADYRNDVLKKIITIKSDYYYVKMATAWCISLCLIKDFDYTLNFLKKNQSKMDIWTYNKALQKGMESLKLDKKKKNILKEAKIH